MKKWLALFFLFFLIGMIQDSAFAQCAMCKATLEANQTNTSKYGLGLNTGILYLMIFPYLAFAIIGYFWYKNAKNAKSGNSLKGRMGFPKQG